MGLAFLDRYRGEGIESFDPNHYESLNLGQKASGLTF
jgi:hypothetical protein